jgi:DNA-binding MarR family transcriptional regulator
MRTPVQPEDAAPPERLWTLVSWLVGHVSVDSRRLVTESFGSAAGRTDFAVLAGIEQYGPISQALLGRRLGVNLGDLVAVLKRLESHGLIVRTEDEIDRRRNAISISGDGRTELDRLEQAALSAQAELLAPLTEQDRGQLVSLLQTLVEHHRSYQRPDS